MATSSITSARSTDMCVAIPLIALAAIFEQHDAPTRSSCRAACAAACVGGWTGCGA